MKWLSSCWTSKVWQRAADHPSNHCRLNHALEQPFQVPSFENSLTQQTFFKQLSFANDQWRPKGLQEAVLRDNPFFLACFTVFSNIVHPNILIMLDVFVGLLLCSVNSIPTNIFANTTLSCFQRNFSEKNIIVVHFSKAGEEVAILRTRNNLVRLTQDWTANCSSMKGHLKLTKCVASKKRSKTAMMHVWPRGGVLKRSYRNLIDENSYNRDTRHYFMLKLIT